MRQRTAGTFAYGILLILGIGVATATAPGASPKTTTAQTAVSTPMNLNTASTAQLEGLPGMGKAMAERIVEYRQKNGGIQPYPAH
jgi:competence protein ComEA